MEYLQYNGRNTKTYGNIRVLNLVISGIPSILVSFKGTKERVIVLNLVISGIPSILKF